MEDNTVSFGEFDFIVKKYFNAVSGAACNITEDYDLSQDIAQNVFFKAYKKYDELKDKKKVGSWLYAITKNECMDYMKRKRLNTFPLDNADDLSDGMDITENITTNETTRKLLECFNKLSDKYRITAILYFLKGCSQKQIASFLDISQDAVESRIRRIKVSLKEEMTLILNYESEAEDDINEKTFQNIRNLIENDKIKESIKALRKALKDFPDNTAYKTMLADNLIKIGETEHNDEMLDEAETILKNIAEREAFYYIPLGNLYTIRKDYDKAFKCYAKLGVFAQRFSAIALHKMGEDEKCFSLYRSITYNDMINLIVDLSWLYKESVILSNINMAYKYVDFRINLINLLPDEKMTLVYLFLAYVDKAKLTVNEYRFNDTIDLLVKAKEYAEKCVGKMTHSEMFYSSDKKRIIDIDDKRYMMKLRDLLKEKPFGKLKGEKRFMDLLSDIEESIDN